MDSSASASALGFAYQGYYALWLMLQTKDEMFAYIEGEDDIVLESGRSKSLFQLKHSLGNPQNLSISNIGFWKAIRIWAEIDLSNIANLFFVSCAGVHEKNPLLKLTRELGKLELDDAVSLFENEMQRVFDEREFQKSEGVKDNDLPHQSRLKAIESFSNLSSNQRRVLISKIRILPWSTNISEITNDIQSELSRLLTLDLAESVGKRLLEWWTVRSVRSLFEAKHPIAKCELTRKIADLVRDLHEDMLIDEFSSAELPTELTFDQYVFTKQIRLVTDKNSIITRSSLCYWRAKNQREKWIEHDFSISSKLSNYDKYLYEEWEDRFLEITESNLSEDQKVSAGYDLLEWSHRKAPSELDPITPNWRKDFLARGTFHILSNSATIGWHQDFKKLISTKDE